MRAVQFDLDDTLFDHKHCSRAGLLAVHRAFAERIDGSFNEFEATYRELLEQLHVKVLVGSMTIDESRIERFRALLSIQALRQPVPRFEPRNGDCFAATG